MLYYFAGLNEYSTADHYPISLSINIIPSLLGALQDFFPKGQTTEQHEKNTALY